MKLTTKSRYGLRLMLDLAVSRSGSPTGAVLLKDIAQRQDISEKYLWQLVNLLKNAGLVSSLRGAHGGYILTRPPREITLKDIVVALDGDVCPVECVASPSCCDRAGECVTREVWGDVSRKIMAALEETDLQTLVEKQIAKRISEALTYEI